VSDRSDTHEPTGSRRAPNLPVLTGRAPDLTDYGRAWEAYRERGSLDDVRDAIAAQGFGLATARTLVYVGIPKDGLPPLRTKLEEQGRIAASQDARLRRASERVSPAQAQQLLAERAQAVTVARRRTDALRGDAAQQMVEEAKLARANRLAVGALLGGMGEVLQAVPALAKQIRTAMESGKLDLRDGLRALKDIALVTSKVAEASRAAVQTEHLVLGKPTSIIGTHDADPDDMEPEEAAQWVALVVRAAGRAALAPSIEASSEDVSDRSDTPPPDDADDAHAAE
jgi:hypothetical protein